MGWEMRAHCGPYYTRSRRVGGRIVREYLGRGESARLIARLDQIEQERKAETRAVERAEREDFERIDREMADFCRRVDLILREHLEAAGYRQHKRGEWRKRRGAAEEQSQAG